MSDARTSRLALQGFKAMLPITAGVIPFGAVMGSVSAAADLTLFQTVSMNVLVFAGAAQLASVDLMTKHAASFVVVVTALIINLRFLLYSAAISPLVQRSRFWTKFFAAYLLTDQNYSVMIANERLFRSNSEALAFYFGASACMVLGWHASVVAGHVFGNFAPASWALDFAVPLSFITLLIPTIKNRKYLAVAAFSGAASILLRPLPYNLGLVVTALLAVALGARLSRRRPAPEAA